MVVPATLADFRAMLDDAQLLTTSSLGSQEITCDNIFAPDDIFIGVSPLEQSFYTWQDDANLTNFDWDAGYRKLFTINSIIDLSDKYIAVNEQESIQKNEIMGSALFFRAQTHWELLQIFAPVYEKNSAGSKMGVVLSLNNDVQVRSPRANLETSYQQVLADLKSAISTLPEQTQYKTRPVKAAGYGLLARIYLSMSEYELALKYADSALKTHSVLLDYNMLVKPSPNSNPFPRFHEEVIYESILNTYSLFTRGARGGYIDSTLYNSYSDNDLRKEMFYFPLGDGYKLGGAYAGTGRMLTGIATDELYLIRAECRARLNNITGAMSDLNTLLSTRWKTGTYVDFVANTEDEALAIILTERRKELIQRGLRWTDLRRLNLDPRFAVTIERVVQGTTHKLLPNDLRYTFLIPNEEIFANDLVEQNPR